METEIGRVSALVEEYSHLVGSVVSEVGKVVIGQRYLVERILLALLTNGHLLIEGVPGLAKTTMVKTLAGVIDARFQRIQFTPDLLPADLLGTLIYNPREGTFSTRKGPIFANIVLADEINRAPAKLHSALLEAMEERQVTIGETSFPLDELFMVLATQNPIEQEGTYPLPEAQMDRFMFKVAISYPSREEEREVMRRVAATAASPSVGTVIHPTDIIMLRSLVDRIYVDEKIEKYILDLVFATRSPSRYGFDDLERFIAYGASPRASIYLVLAARAQAFLRGRAYVVPQDVKDVVTDVLCHRIITTYEADAEGVAAERIVARLLTETEVP
jgi:MoxR-like ATPase